MSACRNKPYSSLSELWMVLFTAPKFISMSHFSFLCSCSYFDQKCMCVHVHTHRHTHTCHFSLVSESSNLGRYISPSNTLKWLQLTGFYSFYKILSVKITFLQQHVCFKSLFCRYWENSSGNTRFYPVLCWWCMKDFLQPSWKEDSICSICFFFHSVNTSTMANFNLPT